MRGGEKAFEWFFCLEEDLPSFALQRTLMNLFISNDLPGMNLFSSNGQSRENVPNSRFHLKAKKNGWGNNPDNLGNNLESLGVKT
jgi:hypothetical protein